ncbi:MAG: GntR family transcriptional regulator, partial [Chloroflexota bacterium]|nr:GntR family transcriptional regulator [Chloroflexota bacterium]
MTTFDTRSMDRDAPLYRGIVQQVRAQIASGVLAPGDRLPPTRELARLLRVNPNTVAHAYSLLEADG